MQVKKRNGDGQIFDVMKIAKAIYRARIDANQEKTLEECVKEAREVELILDKTVSVIDIESIQDAIEKYFLKKDEVEVFKAFTFYRSKRKQDRENPWSNNDERQDIILQKYLKKNETKKEFIERISMGKQSLAKIFRNREAIWGGRNLFAVGREGNITGSNCYVAIAPKDSLQDIYRADYEIARTYSFGGGQGLNLSNIRPKGALVGNTSGTTPGVMVFAEKYSHTTLNTQQESRRGALMLVLNVDHPDVIDFITAKLDISKINGANISLAVTEDFMKAVEEDKNWIMKFESQHEIIQKEVKARELMHLISYANHTVGDPGFLLMDTINDYHLLSEYPEVVFNATNPCGEQPLMENGSCNLGSINLDAFVKNPFSNETFFDLERFREVVMEMTWGLDDLLTILGDRHALEGQRQHVINWREIGLGVMGLADLALSMGLAYGSEQFIKVVDSLMKEMANAAAKASALRAKDMGVFPKYNWENTSKSRFFQEVYTDETKELIKQYGLRNSRLLSIAPTGSISNILGVSGGVEPFFMLGYQRIIKSIFEEEKVIWVYEKTPLKLIKNLKLDNHEELPDWAKVTSQNIKFEDRAKVQATIQKYVDTAISSTFNVPNEATTEVIENIYMTAWKLGLKGATVFRDNCRKVGILSGGGAHLDKNPAPYPTITVYETWVNKKTLQERNYVNKIEVTDGNYKSNKTEHEKCPICGAHLVKQQGCTKCSDPSCVFEKCAI